jgi:hypothetical protein
MTYDQMREQVWAGLRQLRRAPNNRSSLTDLSGLVLRRAREMGQAPIGHPNGNVVGGNDEHLLRVCLAELQVAGIVVYGSASEHPTLPWFQITEYGRTGLDGAEPNPYDPTGYLSGLQQAIPHLDATVVDYLAESLDCFRRQNPLACAVMLGGAAERTLILLIQAVDSALQNAQRKAQFEASAIKEWRLKPRFDALRAELLRIAPLLPRELREDLDLQLDGTFSLIRRARNDAGHPSGTRHIKADQARGALLLFPGFCERCYAIIDHLGQHPVP